MTDTAPIIDPTANVLGLVEAAVKRIDDIAAIRAEYDAELRRKEAERIDAIRAVDVSAVTRAAEVSALQASTLAAQVTASAEALRVALTSAIEPIQKSIEELRRTQYEQAGGRAEQIDRRQVQGASRDAGQWLIGIVMVLALATANVVITVLLR